MINRLLLLYNIDIYERILYCSTYPSDYYRCQIIASGFNH